MTLKSKIKKFTTIFKETEVVPIQHNVDSDQILENKVAIILGGSGGIGLAIARSFVESGCKVILCGTNRDKLDKCLKEIKGANRIKSMVFNINKPEEFKEKVNEAVSLFGKIDILVNSTGVHTENADFFSMTNEEYDRVMNINIKGAYFICKEFAQYMKNSIQPGEKKHILLVSSSRGSEPAWSPYGISKWALNGLTKGLAQILLPYGIIVNSIAPGSTATGLIGVKEGDSISSDENGNGRLIMPDEVASVAKMLVSPTGDMIVGEILHVSGGRGVFDIR